MKRERRSFDKEFKKMAVNLCLTGKATKEVAKDLGVRPELVPNNSLSDHSIMNERRLPVFTKVEAGRQYLPNLAYIF